MSGVSPSTGPYSKTTMRRLVAAAVVLDLIVLAMGVKYALDGHPVAPKTLGIAVVLILLLVALVPLAIRRGRL